jgi:hypothetical protein
MTVQFIINYANYVVGQTVTLPQDTEFNLVRQRIATAVNATYARTLDSNYLAPTSSNNTQQQLAAFQNDSSGNITGLVAPSGTAGYVDAGFFGASPSASATVNKAAIQSALNLGGRVTICTPGTYLVNATSTISSDTALYLGSGVTLKLAPNSNCSFFVNSQWQSSGGGITVTNGISDAVMTPIAFQGERLATADCGANAHGLSVGQYALIKGDTTKAYIGIWKVLTVINAFKFTFVIYSDNAVGSSAGTVTVQRADSNISVYGEGYLDYDGENQTLGTDDYTRMGCVFNKVRDLTVDGITFLNVPKYGIYYGNTQNAQFTNQRHYGASDAVQGIGFNLNVFHQNIRGSTGDDFIAYTTDNTGYTQYNVPNGDMPSGVLIGWTVRDTGVERTTKSCIGLYPSGTYEMSGVLIDGLRVTHSCNNYFYHDTPNTGVSASGVKDITIKNVSGPPSTSYPFKLGGNATSQTLDKLLIGNIDFGAIALTNTIVQISKTTCNRCEIIPNSRLLFNTTASSLYVLQLDNNSSFPSLVFSQCEIRQTAGANGLVLFQSGSSTIGTAIFDKINVYGSSASLFDGTPVGTPTLRGSNCYFDTYSAFRTTGTLNVTLQGNTFGVLGGTPAVLVYGTTSVTVRAYGNNWGTSTSWLKVGNAAGDAVTLNLYAGNNGAVGLNSTILFTSTNNTFYLQMGDSSVYCDKTKWTGIQVGAMLYHTGTTPGVYAQGPTTLTGLAIV